MKKLACKILTLFGIVTLSLSLYSMSPDQQLIDAARFGGVQKIQELIDARANVNARNHYGEIALMIAAAWSRQEIVELLLKHGADITIKSKRGQTALDIAREILFSNPELSQKEKAKYKKIGRMLLEAYIEQRKKPLKEAIFESKKEEARQLAAQHPGIPAQEIIKYLK